MAKRVLSIVIGDEITKVCEISYKKDYKNKGIRVYNSITFPTPANTIEDGYIKDKAAFGQHLRKQFAGAKIKSKRAIFSIASSKIANREVIIPLVKENRIFDIIKTGAVDYFPVELKDYILSYIILEKKTSDRKEKALANKQAKLEALQEKKQTKLDKKAAKKKNKRKDLSVPEQMYSGTKLLFEEETQPQDVTKESVDKSAKPQDKKNNKHIRLSVYAVPSSLVKNYYNFADMIGLELVSIDYSGNSSYQMLKRQSNEGVNVFVQLNERDTVISILKDNILVLQRTIGYGISSLVETVLEQKCFAIQSETEAIELLTKTNLLEWNTDHAGQNVAASAIKEAAAALELDAFQEIRKSEEFQAKRNVIESLEFLVNSISRMLDYYKNNNRNVVFNTIYLSGYGIRINGIDQLFSKRIGIVNKKLEKLNTVSSTKRAKDYRQNPSEFMSCIGSVIKPVDFVPNELIERKQRMKAIFASLFLILLSIGGSGVLCYFGYTDYLIAKTDYNSAIKQMSEIPDISSTKQEFDIVSGQLNDLRTMEVKTHDNEQIIDVLSELQANMLTSSCIQSIQFSDTGVVMSVILSDNNYGANTLVAKLLMQLKSIELFSDVQDSNMVIGEGGDISLTVTCIYK